MLISINIKSVTNKKKQKKITLNAFFLTIGFQHTLLETIASLPKLRYYNTDFKPCGLIHPPLRIFSDFAKSWTCTSVSWSKHRIRVMHLDWWRHKMANSTRMFLVWQFTFPIHHPKLRNSITFEINFSLFFLFLWLTLPINKQ